MPSKMVEWTMADLTNARFYRKLGKGKVQVGPSILGEIRAARTAQDAMTVYLEAVKRGGASAGTKAKWRRVVEAKAGVK